MGGSPRPEGVAEIVEGCGERDESDEEDNASLVGTEGAEANEHVVQSYNVNDHRMGRCCGKGSPGALYRAYCSSKANVFFVQ